MHYRNIYSTNHAQVLTVYIGYICTQKNVHGKKRAWHQTTHVHAGKIKCNTLACLCVQSLCYEMILFMTSGALSFVIYACRNFHPGGMLTNTLGHLKSTAL